MPKTLIIIFLFIISGITSLIYESLWIRVLSLGVGSSSTSISIVLSIFFLGLSLGSYLTGRFINKIKSHLLFYGMVEAFIGIYSFGLIYLLLNFHKIIALLPLSGSFSWLGILFKFSIVFFLLIFPTICMGTTLPLLTKILLKKNKNVGKNISILYGINTLGAVIGAFTSSFIFIPKLGLIWTNHIMVLINLLILLVTFIIFKLDKIHKDNEKEFEEKQNISIPEKTYHLNYLQKTILIACGICGFCSISFEVVWNKYLGIFFGTNIFGLGLILSLYLFGIALGSLLLSLIISHIKDKIYFFIFLLTLTIASSFLASHLLNFAPTTSNIISYYLGTSINLLTIKSIITALILFLPTCFFGALFPLAINIITDSPQKAPKVVGIAYAINTIGSILGSYFAGIVFIPILGSSTTIRISLTLLCFTCMLILFLYSKLKITKLVYSSIIATLLVFTFTTQNISFKNIIKSAYYQYLQENASFSEVMRYFAKDYEEFKLIVEGKAGIISLSHDPDDGENYKKYLRLKTNGLNESFYFLDNLKELPKYEALLGLLPYAFVRNPEKAFVVGYGGGYTIDFLSSTDLKLVYVAELEEGILTAANMIYNGNNPILKRKNLKLEIEDARYVMAAKQHGKFDIIVSQPSHSWLSGVANLFTKEFFKIVKDNLSTKGVFSQWLNLYNLDETTLKSILKTFYSVFPHGAIFTDLDDQEIIMIGSITPLSLNLKKINSMITNPVFKRQLHQVPFQSQFDFLSNFSLGRKKVMELTSDSILNTDINAYAEVNQSNLFYSKKNNLSAPQAFLSLQFDGDYSEILSKKIINSNSFMQLMLEALLKNNKYDKYNIVLQRLENMPYHEKQNYYIELGNFCLQAERYASASKYLKKAINTNPTVKNLNSLINSLIAEDKDNEAITYFNKYKTLTNAISECYLATAYLKTSHHNISKLFLNFEKDIEHYTQQCGDYFNKLMGEYYYQQNNFKTAIDFLEAYQQATGYFSDIMEKLIVSYYKENLPEKAKILSSQINSVYNNELQHIQELANFYRQQNLINDAKILENKAFD